MDEQILEYIKYGVWILFGSGFLFEISPVKIKPMSAILSWIGEKLNKDVRDDISKLQTKVETVQKDLGDVQKDLQDHTVESQRRDILNFANDLRSGQKRTEEHFLYVMKMHDRYEEYTVKNKIENSQADLAYEYIRAKYKEFRDNNGFL